MESPQETQRCYWPYCTDNGKVRPNMGMRNPYCTLHYRKLLRDMRGNEIAKAFNSYGIETPMENLDHE